MQSLTNHTTDALDLEKHVWFHGTIVKPCLIGRFQWRKDHDHVFISPGKCVKVWHSLIKSELLMCFLTFQFSVVDTDNGAQENVVLQRNIKDVHSLLCSDQSSHLWRLKNAVKSGSSLLSNSSLLVLLVALINRFVTEFMPPNILTFYPDLKKTAKAAFIRLWCIRCRCR